MAAGRPPSVPNRGSYQFQPGTWHSVVPLALSNNKTLKNSSRVPRVEFLTLQSVICDKMLVVMRKLCKSPPAPPHFNVDFFLKRTRCHVTHHVSINIEIWGTGGAESDCSVKNSILCLKCMSGPS